MYYLRFALFISLLTLALSVPVVRAEAPLSLIGDTFYPPVPARATRSGTSTPDRYTPSAFLAGSVAVRLVFVESDGSKQPSTESWSGQRRATIERQIRASLDWWAERVPNAHVRFELVSQQASSSYEPISQNINGEKLWVGDALTSLGFAGNNHFEQAYDADEKLRREHNTDWATTIFVVDSENDSDGRFADGYFAYAYVGGPFLVVTSDVGQYGTDRITPVVTHELGHIFGALDQYEAAQIPCTMMSGYLGVPTTNSQAKNCGTGAPSIMIEPISAYANRSVDSSALGQIGYRDSDADSIPDPIDTTPTLSVSLSQQNNQRPRILARAADQPYMSPLQSAISINSIEHIEFRVDGGEWLLLPAADGAYDNLEESVDTMLPLYNGTHTVELRAINRVGTESSLVRQTITVQDVGPAPENTVTVPALQNSLIFPVSVQAEPGTQIQISETPTFRDSVWQNIEQAQYTVTPEDGLHSLYIRLRDLNGLETPILRRLVTVDRLAPSGTAHQSTTHASTLVIEAEDALSGVEAVQIESETGAELEWQPYSMEVMVPSAISPSSIRLRDRAGNISAPLNITRSTTIFLPMLQG